MWCAVWELQAGGGETEGNTEPWRCKSDPTQTRIILSCCCHARFCNIEIDACFTLMRHGWIVVCARGRCVLCSDAAPFTSLANMNATQMHTCTRPLARSLTRTATQNYLPKTLSLSLSVCLSVCLSLSLSLSLSLTHSSSLPLSLSLSVCLSLCHTSSLTLIPHRFSVSL